MLGGSAFKNKGVQAVLDAVVDYLPSPTEVKAIEGTEIDGETVITRESDDEVHYSARRIKNKFLNFTPWLYESSGISIGQDIFPFL